MNSKALIVFTIVLGILSTILTNLYATKGHTVIIPYLFFTILIAYQAKSSGISKFSSRFKINFIAFFLISISLYISIIFDEKALQLSALEHFLRICTIVMLGSTVSIFYSCCLKPANTSDSDR